MKIDSYLQLGEHVHSETVLSDVFRCVLDIDLTQDNERNTGVMFL